MPNYYSCFQKSREKSKKKKSTLEKDPRSPWLVRPANVSNVECSRSHGQSTMHPYHAVSCLQKFLCLDIFLLLCGCLPFHGTTFDDVRMTVSEIENNCGILSSFGAGDDMESARKTSDYG